MTASGDSPSPSDRERPRWHHLVQQSDEPLFVLNARRQVLFVNPAWQLWSGLEAADVRRQVCRAVRVKAGGQRLIAFLTLMAPTPEVMTGQPAQVRRRVPGSRDGCQVFFFPWRNQGRLQAILGRIHPLPAPQQRTASVAPLPEKVAQLREQARAHFRLDLLDSDDLTVRKVATQVRLAGGSDVPVLLRGPRGSGKEWLARTIHQSGPRRDEAFACLDAALLSPAYVAEMLFTRAAGLRLGAVLVKNPARLSSDLQHRLADSLDQESLTPRLFVSEVHAAETARPEPALLARLGAITIELPSLAERRADWSRFLPVVLARAAAAAGTAVRSLDADAEEALRLHSWPANFDEIIRVLRDATGRASGERIQLADLPLYLRERPTLSVAHLELDALLEKVERRLIELALRQAHASRTKAAEFLSIWRARLLRRIEQLGITDPEGPDAAKGTDA